MRSPVGVLLIQHTGVFMQSQSFDFKADMLQKEHAALEAEARSMAKRFWWLVGAAFVGLAGCGGVSSMETRLVGAYVGESEHLLFDRFGAPTLAATVSPGRAVVVWHSKIFRDPSGQTAGIVCELQAELNSAGTVTALTLKGTAESCAQFNI